MLIIQSARVLLFFYLVACKAYVLHTFLPEISVFLLPFCLKILEICLAFLFFGKMNVLCFALTFQRGLKACNCGHVFSKMQVPSAFVSLIMSNTDFRTSFASHPVAGALTSRSMCLIVRYSKSVQQCGTTK